MAWNIFAGMAWFGGFLLTFPKILESMNDGETVFKVALWVVLMLVCLGGSWASFTAEDDDGDSVVSVVKRRRRPRWRRY